MKRDRADLPAVLAIISGSVIGAAFSGALLVSAVEDGPAPVPAAEVALAEAPTQPEAVAAEYIPPAHIATGGIDLVPPTAIAQLDKLLALQVEITRVVEALPEGADDRARRIESLQAQKSRMAREVRELEVEMDHFLTDGSPELLESGMARSAPAETIRRTRLDEKIDYSMGTIEQWDTESALILERTIEADLRAVRDGMRSTPVILVDGVRVELEPLEAIFWGRLLEGDLQLVPAGLIQQTIDEWRSVQDEPVTDFPGIQRMDVLEAEEAIAAHGPEASGGAIEIILKRR